MDPDLDLECLFEFDSPIDTEEFDAATPRLLLPEEKASVGASTGKQKPPSTTAP